MGRGRNGETGEEAAAGVQGRDAPGLGQGAAGAAVRDAPNLALWSPWALLTVCGHLVSKRERHEEGSRTTAESRPRESGGPFKGRRSRVWDRVESRGQLWPRRVRGAWWTSTQAGGQGSGVTGEGHPCSQGVECTVTSQSLRGPHRPLNPAFPTRAGPPVGSSPSLPTACQGEGRPHSGRGRSPQPGGSCLVDERPPA